MKNQKFQNNLFFIILASVVVLTIFLLKSYVGIIIVSGALAIVFKPAYNKILKLVGKRKITASLISVFLVILIVLIPLFLIGFQVYKEASSLYAGLSGDNFSQFNSLLNKFEKTAQTLSPGFSLNLNAQEILSPILSFTVKHMGGIFSGAAKILLNASLGLIALFYFFKEGGEIKKYIANLSPLSSKNNDNIFIALKKTINASIRGGLLVAILQGLSLGVGFIIFGVPNAALWGAVCVVASFVPGVGIALLIIPATIYLIVESNFLMALGFLIWALSTNAFLDYLISPKLKKGAGLHPLLILFSVLGGISLFGAMGIIIGPMIVSLLVVLLKILPEVIGKN
ncbi:MAG: AI-2E family transporter [Candidatus Pacebacteria bacterium]|nr:AI-2E family transporter [Candidatus Paceibacterota bacterium]